MRHLRRCAVLLSLVAAACSNSEQAREKSGITPTYDRATGRLQELAYDSNHDGRVETWTEMEGARPLRTRIDRNEDGRLDRWEYYDGQGRLEKVGFSRRDDGKPDAWAFSAADGRLERIEISSAADEKVIDRWERYDASGLISAEEDANTDGLIDKWDTYRDGALTSVAFDENADGRADRRMTYQGGTPVLNETGPDAAGQYAIRVEVK